MVVVLNFTQISPSSLYYHTWLHLDSQLCRESCKFQLARWHYDLTWTPPSKFFLSMLYSVPNTIVPIKKVYSVPPFLVFSIVVLCICHTWLCLGFLAKLWFCQVPVHKMRPQIGFFCVLHAIFFTRILFIRIIRLKSDRNKNYYLRIMFRLRSCCGTFKSCFPWFSRICVKVKNHLRIFPAWEFKRLRITLRLAWIILILIKKLD